jgi:hypothetical protein
MDKGLTIICLKCGESFEGNFFDNDRFCKKCLNATNRAERKRLEKADWKRRTNGS